MTRLYNQQGMKQRRRELRNNMTYEESVVWNILRKYFPEARFRRQYSLGPYILDFYSVKYRIAIEIDGVQHLENKEYDKERDNYTKSCNIKILRFWNSDIKTNLNGVLITIAKEISM